MEYTIKRSHRKTLAISIVDGQVIVRAPLHLDFQTIEKAIKSKESWIQDKLNLYHPTGINISSTSLRVYGEYKELELEHGDTFSVTINDKIKVSLPKNHKKETIEKKIEDFLKKELEVYLDYKVSYYANLLGIKKPSYIIRRYKRIYGRCNQKGELAFNLYLFHEPFSFIDYVVLHECAHILEFNHSKSFYNIIKKHMPNYKEIIRLSKI